MNDLMLIALLVLVGVLAHALVAGRRCRCADAARTTQWRRDDVVVTSTMRGIVPGTSVASATVEMAAAPARSTRVGY